MAEVSTVRLYTLRAAYLLLAVGLGSQIWPGILDPSSGWQLSRSIVVSMLGALSALSLLGLRYPLQMLPLLFFELTWKAIWLTRVALPLWCAHRLDAATAETAAECLTVVVFLFLIPWRYVFDMYARKSGDRWAARATA